MWKSRGQSIRDRLLAAHYTVTGDDVAKAVCKATTEQPIAPKKKHLDYLVFCSNKPNVQIAELANILVKRARSSNWIVVFKTLITTHHIIIHGNERVLHYLASSSTNTFELEQFLDRNSAYGIAMSPYIRRYAKYLNRKISAYRTVVCDFCRVKSEKHASAFSTMSDEALLETLVLVQEVLDALLRFDCSVDDLSNGIIVVAVNLLFRDLIRLFVFYNEGVISLLRRYFDMKKKQCEEALILYKNFLARLDCIPGFIKVCEATGLNSGGVCELRHAPDSLLDALEQHLRSLDGGKPQGGRAFDLWLQTRAAANKVMTPESTCDLCHRSFVPHLGNEQCKEPRRNIKLDTSEKLDFIYDDPMKLIRNPFVSVELLATKPAPSPADICTNYAPITAPSYVAPAFVSDEDFAAAFRQAESCNVSHAAEIVNAVHIIRQENIFWKVEHNFSFDRRGSVGSPPVNFPRNTSGWWPQQLTSKSDPGYLPMQQVGRS